MANFSKSKTKGLQITKHVVNNDYQVFGHKTKKDTFYKSKTASQVFGHKMQKNAFYKSKKGAIEVQFGWIFVMIVGALILLFFVSVVKTTSKSSTDEKNVDLVSSVKSMISQSEIDVGTTRTTGMPGISLDFECDNFKIQDAYEYVPYKTIFSPNLVKGRQMITYSKYFEMPFKVDYFVYVTSKEVRYNFINDSPAYSNLLSDIIKELPENITYQVKTLTNQVTENNYYKDRFIFFGASAPSSLTNSFDKLDDVVAIRISPSASNSMIGGISYFNKTKNDHSFLSLSTNSQYLGIPMLIGAIFSEGSLYDCNVKKTIDKFKIVSNLYTSRTDYLTGYYSNYAPNTHGSRCYYQYLDAKNNLDKINLELSKTSMSFPIIYNSKNDLENTNKELMIESCPMIY